MEQHQVFPEFSFFPIYYKELQGCLVIEGNAPVRAAEPRKEQLQVTDIDINFVLLFRQVSSPAA
jgi:hypothetical protein